MVRWLDKLLDGKPMWAIAAVTLVLVLLLGSADHLTGYELSFSVFYLVPIAIAAWYGTRRMGYVASGISAAAWMIVERISAVPYSEQWILYWNSAVRLMVFLIVAYLIRELRATLRRHQKLARTDNLTGLLNRAGFIELAEKIVAAASRYGHATALAYIDLDGFKAVNDTLGHSQGDEVLKTVGALLDQSGRGSDVVGRLGGDEFAILLPNTDLSGAHSFFNKLHDELSSGIGPMGASLGFSIGAVVFESGPPSLADALRLADTLMYRAKRTADIVVETASSIDAALLRKATADR